MKKKIIAGLLIAAGFGLSACYENTKQSDKNELFAIMAENPQMMLEVLKSVQNYQQEQYLQQKWDQEKNQNKIIDYKNVPMLGNKEAKNTVLVYYSYLCSYCTQVHQFINEIMKIEPDTKVYFKIVSSDKASLKTAAIFNYLAKTDIYKALAFNTEIFNNQQEYYNKPEKTIRNALLKLNIKENFDDNFVKEFEQQHKENLAEYKNNNCEGTPTFIVNNKYSVAGLVNANNFSKIFNK